ncbi:MAG: DUF512 domain-containing protein [candidate division Zixibacteria bacterium]|nr:DUF512 domain-containing protein [candidate division Zixibacteria bacterium]
MLKVAKINPGMPGNISEIRPGDQLMTINGVEIKDIIDFRFHEADQSLEMALIRGSEAYTVNIEKDIDQQIGLEFETDRIIRCRNKCVFCFCFNNPKHLRRALYVKDDDYRYSFLHGSFITLTNLSEADIQRIIDMRLSPMYVSVHATDMAVRKRLFGRENTPDVMPILRRFAENHIDFHCQIVVLPGYNDKDILRRTAADLAELKPYAQSMAIVPIGLTKFSRPDLQSVGPKRSAALINETAKFRRKYGDKENRFAYAADELFITAGEAIPKTAYYDDFPQIENGIGMVRDFLDTFPRKLPANIRGNWITGQSMAMVWKNYIMPKYNFKLKLIPVTNGLFGPRVTVSGLLPGKDILARLAKVNLKNEPIILPPNCLNHDGLFIDDLTVADIQDRLGVEVLRGEYSFAETLRMVA